MESVHFSNGIFKYENLKEDKCINFDDIINQIHSFKLDIIKSDSCNKEIMQDFGDNLRGTGNPFKVRADNDKKFEYLDIISDEVNNFIKYYRRRPDSKKSNYFVIDSFRNPEEIIFFRKRYGSFFLCSIYSNKEIRKERMEKNNETFSEERDTRDQGKNNSNSELHKQNITDCVLISDYAINNETNFDDLKYKIIRLLCLIDRPGCVLPTAEEAFMNIAYNLSLRSTCLSRQVGAVITNQSGYIIGAGWNDVGTGQLGCSTRCKEDYNKYTDNGYLLSVWRDSFEKFKLDGLLNDYDDCDYICFKDIQSKEIISNKIDNILNKYIEKKDEKEKEDCIKFSEEIKEKLKIKRLEYARSLHAEENAILQVAIHGGIGIKGGIIYSTTFPCELCAKKIYQAGIKKIVYTEPYPNSISDKILLKDGIRNIELEQFEGVKSISFYKLFKSAFDKKDMQQISSIYYKE